MKETITSAVESPKRVACVMGLRLSLDAYIFPHLKIVSCARNVQERFLAVVKYLKTMQCILFKYQCFLCTYQSACCSPSPSKAAALS